MPCDGRAAQPLEDADLDFLWSQGHQAVKPGGEAFQRFAWHPHDQVRMDVHACPLAQESEARLDLRVILLAVDAHRHLGVEGLDAYLELQRAGRELGH